MAKRSAHAKPQGRTTQAPPRLAKEYEAPRHLVGKAYINFTSAEHWETKKWRRARTVCDGCGQYKCRPDGKVKSHTIAECPLRKRKNQERIARGQCIECAKTDHEWTECPVRKRLEAELEPFGDYHSVPKDYRGWSIATVKEVDPWGLVAWRLQHDLCRECGASDHKHYTCKERLERVQERYNKNLAAFIAKGEDVKLGLDGKLGALPRELRIEIVTMAMHESKDITVQPGWLTEVRGWLRVGLPLAEVISSFIQGNVFVLPGPDGYDRAGTPRCHDVIGRFVSFLTRYNAADDLRAVYLENNLRDLPVLLEHCHGIKKLRLPLSLWVVSHWREPMYINGGAESLPEVKIPNMVAGLDLQTLATIASLKGISFHAEQTEEFVKWGRVNKEGFDLLLDMCKTTLANFGRQDIYVGYSYNGYVSPAVCPDDYLPVYRGADEAWEKLGLPAGTFLDITPGYAEPDYPEEVDGIQKDMVLLAIRPTEQERF